ncbi:pyridoxal phosphate-dependent aminotransferase [Eisenibacter elegans]|uniref:pyridoxal phosphate-dependent aminotransferase n=1 Tax=Eisenibacter elegans TaxID=997 RepID=UPI00041D95BA|nr:pyridoxal phosphate-dependent aminotransferase [Eisenibacter elegans]
MTAPHTLLSARTQAMSESATLAMAKKARELAAQGVQVINLSLGEPDFQTPKHICEAAKKAIDEGYTKYPPVAGYADLRQAIAEKFARENQIHCEAKHIVVSTGAKQSLANLFLALVDEGDEVVIFAPYWVSYVEMVRMAGGTPVILESDLESGFKVSPDQLAQALSPRTKAVLYSSPSNPTGAVYSRSELEALAQVLEAHPQVLVIADEIYEHITFGERPFSMAAIPSMAERVATVNGLSKGFSMTGWRLGYMAAPAWLAEACEKIQGQITSGASSITQRAALAALQEDLTATYAMRDAYLRRRDLVISLCNAIEGIKTYVPDGAFYLFPEVDAFFGRRAGTYHIQNADDLCMYLLHEAHVSLVSGGAFGAPKCLRISFAASDEQIREAFARIARALAQLQ